LWNLSGNKASLIATENAHNDCKNKQDNTDECDTYQPSIKSLNRSNDNKRFVSAGDDRLAKLWEIDGDKIKLITTFKRHTRRINSVNFSPECKDATNSKCKIATASDDGTVKIWNPVLPDQQLLEIPAHPEGVEVVRFSPKENSNILATASKSGMIKLWEIKEENSKINPLNFAEFKGNQGSIVSFRFRINKVNKDELELTTAGKSDGIVRFWKVIKKSSFLKLEGHQKPIYSVRYNPVKNNEIATASDDGTFILWDISTQPPKPLRIPVSNPNDKIKLKSIRFSPNGQRIATTGSDGEVRLWSRNKENKLIQDISFKTNQDGTIWSVNFHPKENRLATAGSDGTVKIWDFKGNRLGTAPDFKNPEINNSKVESVRFSREGNILAIVGENGKAGLWKTSQDKLIELKGHQGTVYGVGFSPNDKEVVTVGDDGTIRRWDLSGKPLGEPFKTYQGSIKNISFSEDGKILATAGYVGTVKLWTTSGQLLADLKGHEGIVRSVNFRKDGKRLVTAGDDGVAIVWEIKYLDELMQDGCSWLKDYLSTHQDEQKELHDFCQSNAKTAK
jgi:WD40 repeat protein